MTYLIRNEIDASGDDQFTMSTVVDGDHPEDACKVLTSFKRFTI